MPRNFPDWLQAYVDYASFSEAPPRMHFWTGVSTVAGALRRRVWIDQRYFKWTPCFFIILVAPPGIVSKSTTAAIGMNLLRKVPGIQFGPDIVTWPALVSAFADATESFQIGDEWHTQCALTLESSELGNLVNPADREQIDLLVNLWDSKQGGFRKVTKGSGKDSVENPWINIIACTTPAWIAGNFPEYVIGGGFTSRCLFVYAEKKEKLVAFPHLAVPTDMEQTQFKLVQDLEHIATALLGPYTITPDAIAWEQKRYSHHFNGGSPEGLQDDRFQGYLARKQTLIFKTAMVIAASTRDELIITDTDLYLANKVITDLEQDMPKVFAKIGRTEESVQAERFINYIKMKRSVPYKEAYAYIHMHFPKASSFEEMMKGAVQSGQIRLEGTIEGMIFKAID